MSILRRLALAFALACLPVLAYAQADMGVSAIDTPDPVAPDGNISYAVTVTNGGPSATTNAHLNIFLNGSLLYQSSVIPAGWNCGTLTVGSGAPITCTAAVLAMGTSNFTIVLKAPAANFGINDTTIVQNFSVNSALADGNSANDSVNVSTAYVAPDADMQISVSDAPDPVFPDGNVTYTINVTNAGPDTAVNAHMNMSNNGSMLYQSSVIPAGWNCGAIPAGTGAPISCTNPSFPSGGMATFSLVMKAPISSFGVTDQTIVRPFSANSDVADPDHSNDSVNVSTAYVTPDADMQVTASDSPDPVFPDGNITYTVNVTNAGPDTAPNAHLNVPLNGTLLFQSVTAPAGWNCGNPPVNSGASFTCTNTSFAPGLATITVVLKAGLAQFGPSAQTIVQNFGVNSGVSDPNNANDSVNVSTAYVVLDANLSITAADAPDPVVPGNNLTFTINFGNAGPDPGANTVVSVPLQSSLRFVSITSVAGFNCSTPAVGATGTVTCTNPSFANGGAGTYTLVTQVDPALLNGPGGSIVQNFSIGSDTHDPSLPNNSAQTTTAYQTPAVADLSVTKSTQATTVAPGGTVSFTITAHNNGPSAATSVVLTDALPASLLFQSLVVPAGFNCSTPAVGGSGTITCNAASFANGATAVFTLNTTVANNATGAITNNATISAAETDGSGGNNGGSSSPVAIGPSAPASPIPTLSEWALLALAALLGAVAVTRK